HITTSTDYDFNTSLAISRTNAAGLVTNIGYNAALQQSSVTLPTGANAAANFNYANLSATSTTTYDDLGTQKTITSTTQYDGWGRVISVVAPNNAQTNTAYDAMGRVISRTNPFQSGGAPAPATTSVFDNANRAVVTTMPDGNIVRNDYNGSAVTITDQVNRKIKRDRDGLGRLIKLTEQTPAGALTQETSYTYSLLDQATLVNQGNQGRSYKYDALGRLLYEKIPEQTPSINDGTGTLWTTAYAYTEYGAVKRKTDARGVESHYTYDALHRVTQIWYTGVGGDDAGAVRPALPAGVSETPQVGVVYTATGQLSQVYLYATSTVPNSYQEDYVYDAFDRVQSVKRWILGQAYDVRKTYTTSYEYNLGSQLTRIVYPSGQEVWPGHDNIGRINGLFPVEPQGQGSGYLYNLSYNIAGQVTGLTLGNGVVESYGYDANRSQLTSQTATKGANTLINLTYSYQASAGQMGTGSTAGNAGQLMSASGTVNGTTESAGYTYDLVGRLETSSQTSNGSSAQRRFAYDRWGNRTGVWDAMTGGTQIQSVSFPSSFQQGGSAPTNRIASVTNSGSTVNYTYDAAGNVTNDGAHAYTYDAENRLVSVDAGATAQYRYDHKNQRVCKIIGSSWTHCIWEGGRIIAEHDATTPYSSNPTYQVKSARLDYLYAGSRLIQRRDRPTSTALWTTRYYLSDPLSVRMTLDSAGNVSGRQTHLPFGEDFGESGTQEKHHFTSYERDTQTGLDYAVNRYAQTSTGRFLQVDRHSGDFGAPQSLNKFSYTRNDPKNLTDPNGLFVICARAPSLGFFFSFDPFEFPEIIFGAPILFCLVIFFLEPPPKYWTGFSQNEINTINNALALAFEMLGGKFNKGGDKGRCNSELTKKGIDVKALASLLLTVLIKPASADPRGLIHGVWRVFNGENSNFGAIENLRNNRSGVPAAAVKGGEFLGRLGNPAGDIFVMPFFFQGRTNPMIPLSISQAIVMMHEVIHLTGKRDEDFAPGKDQEVGSRALTDLII
ncbi:MAG: RHS repeat-associated core domain-containing protein, partial [Blastocatellia bacterium]